MQITRRTLLIASGVTAALVGACAEREKLLLVALKVSASGRYEVNGKEVDRDGLESALAALKPTQGIFGIHFQPDKAAPYESVQFAMSIAQKLGARVGIVGNEQFLAGTPHG